MPSKVCRTCDETKGISEFYDNKNYSCKKDAECIDCKKKYMREWWKRKQAIKKSNEKIVVVSPPTEEMVERPLDKGEIISIDSIYIARCGRKTKRLEYNTRTDGYNITALFDNGILRTVTSHGKASAIIDHPYDLTHEYIEKSLAAPPKDKKTFYAKEILVEMKKQPVSPEMKVQPPVIVKEEKVVVSKMKALTVTYEEVRTNGNYGNRKVGVTIQVGDNDTAADALKFAKKFVCLELDRPNITVTDYQINQSQSLLSKAESERKEPSFDDIPF